jgi:GNAT acetyltransferase-like protein
MTSVQASARSSSTNLGTSTYEINPLQDPRWNSFTDQCTAASVAHRREWLHSLNVAYGCEPIALSTCSPASVLTNALVFCRVRSWITGNRLVSLPFTDHCEPLATESAEVDCLVASLSRTVAEGGWRYFEMRPAQYVPSPQFALRIFKTYFSHRLDLRRSEEAMFSSFHRSCIQRKILKAERESLRYEEGSSEALLQQFYKLLVMTRRRFGLPPQPLKWFRNLIASLGQDLKIRVVSKESMPVASILTIHTKQTMVYKYGGSDARFNNLGGMVFLLWNAIREARATGTLEFDLGRSDVDQQGLIAFKEHWGAARSTLNYWCYPPPKALHGHATTSRLLKKLASRAPDSSLVMLGNLLYKHIA